MRSKKRPEKGYLLPDPITGYDLKCVTLKIPDDATYQAAFVGAMHTLDQWWNWEKSYEPGDTRAAQAALYWRTLIDEFLQIGECMPDLIDVRQNNMTPCILEKNIDGEWTAFADLQKCPPKIRYGATGDIEWSGDDGETWQPIDDPPPQPPRGEPPEGQDNKCLAAANAVAVILAAFQQCKADFDNGLSIIIVLSALISLLATLIFFPPAFAVVLATFTALYGILSSMTLADFSGPKQDALKCILFNHATLTDTTVTFDYGAVQDDVFARANFAPANIWAAIWYLLSILGSDGLNRAGSTTSVGESDCDDCDNPCEGDFCYSWPLPQPETNTSAHPWWGYFGATYGNPDVVIDQVANSGNPGDMVLEHFECDVTWNGLGTTPGEAKIFYVISGNDPLNPSNWVYLDSITPIVSGVNHLNFDGSQACGWFGVTASLQNISGGVQLTLSNVIASGQGCFLTRDIQEPYVC